MGNKTNVELRAAARESLKGNWGSAIGAFIIYSIVAQLAALILPIPVAGYIAWSCIVVLLAYGIEIYALKAARDKEFKLNNMFCGFKDSLPKLTTLFLGAIYVCLWSLLFVIPGVVKLLSYSMVSYIIEEKGLKNNEAIEESMRMMEGHKMRLFLMTLHFMLLAMLSVFTLFIGLLWLTPYVRVTMAQFYLDLKANDHGAAAVPAAEQQLIAK